MNIRLEKLVSTGSLWFIPSWTNFPLLNYFIHMGKFYRASVPLAAWSLRTSYLQNKVTRFHNRKGRKGIWAVTQPIADRAGRQADVGWQKEDCPPKWKMSVPTMDKEKENCGHQHNVCVFWQHNRSMVALCFVGGCLVLWKAKRRSTPRSWGWHLWLMIALSP